uniref:NADH dehydrogenase [ubiquinone] 1 alpha subcomplex subunit 8 n=1 Tax=Scolopendra viridis TaxID=118503 RepID=A0A4D5R9S1_SCOVI
MPVYSDTWLPTEEELTVQEITVSTPVLRAGALHLGKYCEEQSKEYMLCRKELRDPRKCIDEGKAVTSCALDFFRKMKEHCKEEMHKFADCLNYTSANMEYKYCRKTQNIYDLCVLNALNLERPEIGYYSRPKIHDSRRPKPPPEPSLEFPDATPSLPPDYPRQEPVFGRGRTYE